MSKEIDGKNFYPFCMDHLPENFIQKAQEELNETPETKEIELKNLKDLISADKLTTGIEFEEDFLVLFLRYTKYKSSKAFQAFRNFLNFRKNYSSIFQGVPREYFEVNPSTKFISALPYRCPDGCAVILSELGKWNHDELTIEDIRAISMATCLQALRCPMTQISGFKIIHDFKDTFKHIRYCNAQNLSILYNAVFKCFPGRYKEFHFINKSPFLMAIWAVLKHVLPDKIKGRMFFHSKPEDLLNYFPSSIIPIQFGGSLSNYHDSQLMKKMNEESCSYPETGQPNYY